MESSTADRFRGAPLDPISRRWVDALCSDAAQHQAAVSEFHQLLIRVAGHEVNRRGSLLGLTGGPELDDLANQAADDALMAIRDSIDSFRGESRFTTWAFKFVIFKVSSSITRHAWRRQPPAAADFVWEGLAAHGAEDPHRLTAQREVLRVLSEAITERLTERQRSVFVAAALNEVPIDFIALSLGSNRNAIYKNLFDARRTLRRSLDEAGLLSESEEVEL